MTPRYRTAFSVPSGFAAAAPAVETPAQKFPAKARGKVAAPTRAQAAAPRIESDKRDSAAA